MWEKGKECVVASQTPADWQQSKDEGKHKAEHLTKEDKKSTNTGEIRTDKKEKQK